MPQESRRHHYLPVFYLKGWCRSGRICEYSRPHRDVVVQTKAPSATGFAIDLYTVPSLPQGDQQFLEDIFFRKIDQTASDALDILLDRARGPAALSPTLRDGWSRFLLSLRYRTPVRLAALRERYDAHVTEAVPTYRHMFDSHRDPGDERSFEEFCADIVHDARERSWARLLWEVIDSQRVGNLLNNMYWNVMTVTGSDRRFLTSDDPVVMTDGLDRPDGHLLLPLGPSRMFLATRSLETFQTIERCDVRRLQRDVNDRVVRQAHRYVYGHDQTQRRFVENRLVARPTPIARGLPSLPA